MTIDLTRILEVFGVRGSKTSVRVTDTPNGAKDSAISLTVYDTSAQTVCISAAEARYLAERLTYLADKADRRFGA